MEYSENIKKRNSPRDKSSEVTFPSNKMSFELDSALVSQNLILWSKWPLIIVEPAPSEVTRSLQLEPANFVSIPANKQDLTQHQLPEFLLIYKQSFYRSTVLQSFYPTA